MNKPKCPLCQTAAYVVPEAWGEKVGTVVGGGVGLGLAVSKGVGAGAVIGTAVASELAPSSRLLGTTGGAVIGGLAGALSIILGCSAMGRKVGLEVDEHLIKSYHCNRCDTIISAYK